MTGWRTMTGWRPASVAGVMLAAVLLSGCTGPDVPAAGGESASRPATAEPLSLEIPASFACHGTAMSYDVSTAAVRDARPATELGPRAAATVTSDDLGPNSVGAAFDELPADWIVVEETDERVVLLGPHELAEGEGEYGSAPVFDLRLFLIDTERPADLTKWFPTWGTMCTLSIPLDPLGVPDVTLDASSQSTPSDTSIDLLVLERSCNGGKDAEGRVELVELRETAETVELVIGVRPHSAEDFGEGLVLTCQGHPPTPFVVELSSPLGDRTIINAGRFPADEIVESSWGLWG